MKRALTLLLFCTTALFAQEPTAPPPYFGMYQFPGAERFAYSRLLQVSNYAAQEPYTPLSVTNSQAALETFFRRNGYFRSSVQPLVEVDESTGLANINFQVDLRRLAKVGEISITGTSPELAQSLKQSLWSLRARMLMSGVRPGKKYSLKTLESAKGYLEGVLNKQGHLGAQVRLTGASYNAEANLADIAFDVRPGPVVIGRIEGAHLWSWTKRKLLPIYQQAGVTPELIQEGRQNLLTHFRQKGYFDVQVDSEFQVETDPQTVLYRIDKGSRKKITNVVFVGAAHYSEDVLLDQVSVSFAGILSKGKYNEASLKTLKAFYQSHGYNQVKVTPQFVSSDGTVVVTFVVEEGPQDIVDSVRVQGNTAVSQDMFAPDGLHVGSGQPYAQQSMDQDRNRIMAYYLEHGYLTVTLHAIAMPSAGKPQHFQVIYDIVEGPQVHTRSIFTLGRGRTQQRLIEMDTAALQPGRPLTETDILSSESRLYTRGIYDWAEVRPRREITSRTEEDVVVRVHEARRNSLAYGFGFERINRGGNVPSGTVALPGLPTVGWPAAFTISQRTFRGPRASLLYARTNLFGKAATLTFAGLAGTLVSRASFTYMDPHFRWSRWASNLSVSTEHSRENPLFTTRSALFGFQLQRALDLQNTRNVFLRYSFAQTGLTDLLIPELIPHSDQHTRLSTVSGTYVRDTRDNPLDEHKGAYRSMELDINPSAFGSNVNFGKLLAQAASYRGLSRGMIWANNLRMGILASTDRSRVPLSQKFFTGGGSTLRGFPLNGAGPQRTIPVCANAADPSTCSLIRVPTGGVQLLIVNSELRVPLKLRKGLSVVAFYDGGNVYDRVGVSRLARDYTNSVGVGARYLTPVGPVRIDIGRNLKPISGIKATQFFITLGQAF